MDTSVNFNISKCEEFMIRNKFRALKKADDTGYSKKFVREDSKCVKVRNLKRFAQEDLEYSEEDECSPDPDEVKSFFMCHRNDRYHWSRNDRYHWSRTHVTTSQVTWIPWWAPLIMQFSI